MLMDRIIKAFTFKKEVYADVEKDESFTTSAWLIVIVVSIIAALGSFSFANFGASLLGLVIGAILNAIAFALAAFVINLVGRAFFKAQVTFTELVRTLGLAYVWNVVNVIGILGGLLSCLLVPVRIIAWVALVVSWLVAVKEALDLDWVPTIVTVVLGWIVIIVVQLVTSLILGAMGIAGGAIFGALGG
jgi:hypothetical protein